MSDTHYPALSDIDAIQQAFESAGYICTTRIATVVRLAAALEKPVLIESASPDPLVGIDSVNSYVQTKLAYFVTTVHMKVLNLTLFP